MSKKGRPIGYVMSYETKRRISESMVGRKQKAKTKRRISEGVRKERLTGAPIELIMKTDFGKVKKHWANRYWNCYIENPKNKTGHWMRLHRAVIEQHLERKLRRGEVVHHLGSIELNRPEFLRVCKNWHEHWILDKFKKRRLETFGSEAEYDSWLITINGGTE